MAATDTTALENMFTTWAAAITGRPFYVRDKMGPQPTGAYGTLHVGAAIAQDNDRVSYNSDFTTETVRGLSEVQVLFEYYGGNPTQSLTALKNSISSAARYRDIWTICGRGNVGEVKDLSTRFLGKIEPRAEFRMSVWAALSTSVSDPDYFESDTIIINEHDRGEVYRERIGINHPPAQSTEGC